jgi:FixJ family two-component response regulator
MSEAVIHVVDDDLAMRAAITRLLRAEGYEVRSYASVGEFLLNRSNGPGCLVLDLQLPGPNGLELQESLRSDPAAPPIVFLTGQGDIASAIRAMKGGAIDFLTKPVDPSLLLQSVTAALARDRERRDARARTEAVEARLSRLTVRERSVYERVIAGKLNKQIAGELGITERTVKMHRAQIMTKMEAGSLAELVHIADLLGIPARPPVR